ncbi:MAG: korA, partial [Modestobacter sp.]|nr:korA [Modestobacter sp.]
MTATPNVTAAPDDASLSAPGGLVKSVVALDRVVIRLAGDSGDGMQLTGGRFTS